MLWPLILLGAAAFLPVPGLVGLCFAGLSPVGFGQRCERQGSEGQGKGVLALAAVTGVLVPIATASALVMVLLALGTGDEGLGAEGEYWPVSVVAIATAGTVFSIWLWRQRQLIRLPRAGWSVAIFVLSYVVGLPAYLVAHALGTPDLSVSTASSMFDISLTRVGNAWSEACLTGGLLMIAAVVGRGRADRLIALGGLVFTLLLSLVVVMAVDVRFQPG